MRTVELFIAASVDGFIADPSGGVGWLAGQGEEAAESDSYSRFIQNVDTVVMGWNTYRQIVTELSPGAWVYHGLTTYVVTHRTLPNGEEEKIFFTPQSPCDLIRSLRQEPGKTVWVCGGASIVQQLVRADLIDRYYLTVIPTLLGSGIRLFENGGAEKKLRLVETRQCDGMLDILYERRKAGR